MVPLLTILIIVVVHHMCNVVGLQYISQLVFRCYCQLFPSKIQELKAGIVQTRLELQRTSAQDQFAKWAKLRRKFDKEKAAYDQAGIPF
jgi:hypothetical protein